jgi:L-alanine-DL-glutamate epimerase-like enolase superfamily enzyme
VALKLKVADLAPADALTLARSIRVALPDLPLRLDANGAWDEATAGRMLVDLEPLGRISVEQPLAPDRLTELARLRAATRVPLALDESVGSAADLEQVLAARAADEVVLKPMFCGGPLAALALARRAVDAGLTVSITHALESAVGRAGAVHLAAACPAVDGPCGLAPALAADLAPGPAVGGDGHVRLPEGPGLGVRVPESLSEPGPTREEVSP